MTPDLLKALAILSHIVATKTAVNRVKLKPNWKSEKSIISLGDQQACCLQVFNNRKKTNMVVVFSRTPFLNILRCKDHRCDLPEIWKLRFHQTHIPELANMYESSSSHFASTAEIQSGPDAFDKSRFVMTFFNQMVVIEALCSFSYF